MTPYHNFVQECLRAVDSARTLPLGGFPFPPAPDLAADAPAALFFSPHPDDECISGGLALRILREARWRVVNVAVTQGSKRERQAARFQELAEACKYLGLGLEATAPNGLERINPKTRAQDPQHWGACVDAILAVLQKYRPKVVLFPHERDWNSTHIGTHLLVVDALKRMPADFECYCVETEFWGAMDDPNLMIEISAQDIGDMITALSYHVGEVNRNPYHLTLPAWMMDNVRRGGEVVGGQGGAAPDFRFAVLNRLRRWKNGTLERFFEGGKQVPAIENVRSLFP